MNILLLFNDRICLHPCILRAALRPGPPSITAFLRATHLLLTLLPEFMTQWRKTLLTTNFRPYARPNDNFVVLEVESQKIERVCEIEPWLFIRFFGRQP